ncbi:hypothetical protein GCM10009612_49050 [Streptomyces beijiangensis]
MASRELPSARTRRDGCGRDCCCEVSVDQKPRLLPSPRDRERVQAAHECARQLADEYRLLAEENLRLRQQLALTLRNLRGAVEATRPMPKEPV